MVLVSTSWFCLPTALGQTLDPALFLHTDKSIYTGNEIIWFSGYLLNVPPEEVSQYTTLFVGLYDPVTRKPVLESRFAMESTLAQGVLQLPDSFPAHEYLLVAYTDHLFTHPDDHVFQTWISVRYSSTQAIPYLSIRGDSLHVRPHVWATLSPDSTLYHRRSHTTWTVRLTDSTGHPVRGIFSVACVRKTRLINREPDILYFPRSSYRIPGLIKDTMPPFFLQVGYGRKPTLKNPICLLISHDTINRIVQTEKDGSLRLSPNALKAPYGSKVTLTVIDKKNQEDYKLTIAENDKTVNAKIATIAFPYNVALKKPSEVFTEEEFELSKVTLAKVVVKAHRVPDYKRPEYYQLPVMEGPCAAWVCDCGHWKCLACPPTRNPVKGFTYEDRETGRMIKYEGCPLDTVVKPFLKRIPAVNYARPFQGVDYSKEHGESMNFNTTLYWNYLVTTDDDGRAAFDFFTNDLVGTFICTLQGIGDKGAFSASQTFTVRPSPESNP